MHWLICSQLRPSGVLSRCCVISSLLWSAFIVLQTKSSKQKQSDEFIIFPSDSPSLITLTFHFDSSGFWNWRIRKPSCWVCLNLSWVLLRPLTSVILLCGSISSILGLSLVHFPPCGLCWFIVPLWLPLHGDVTGFQEADKWLSVRTDELHCESRGLAQWDEGQMHRNANANITRQRR